MPRRRAAAGGVKPSRNKVKPLRFRSLLPRVGFDFVDRRCRRQLAGIESELIKERIRASSSAGLNKAVVEQALALLFENVAAAVAEDPEAIAAEMPGVFWGELKNTVPWAAELSGPVVFKLVAALLQAQEAYLARRTFEKWGNQFGRLALAVRALSTLLHQHHGENLLFLSSYFDVSVALGSDGEDEEEEGTLADDEDEGQDDEEKEDVEMENVLPATRSAPKRARDDDEDNDDDADREFGVKRRELGLGNWVYTKGEKELAGVLEGMALGQ